MTVVTIQPLADWMRKTKYKPQHPPVFESEGPTQDDIALALELFEALDDASKDWYGGERFAQRLRARLP
jgi:hypothetical protein